MGEQKRFSDRYLAFSEKTLKKLRYKTNVYDKKDWTWLKVELILLMIYHIISILIMGTPTPVSLFLNTIMVARFIIGNSRENKKVIKKVRIDKTETGNEYISIHAMIAICEGIATGVIVTMILWLGVDNNIGQIEFATVVIVCISFLEGWKDISVSFFDATPMIF